jgi:hypothetical protein
MIYTPGSVEWYAYQAGIKQGLHQAAIRHLGIANKDCPDCGQPAPCNCCDNKEMLK